MSNAEKLFEFEYLAKEKVLIGKIKLASIEKDEAAEIYDYASTEKDNQPDYEHFILDVRSVDKVTNPAIGLLMKSLGLVKKTKGYMILVMTETLLQEIMLVHPEMFDFYVVFHSINDAVAYATQ